MAIWGAKASAQDFRWPREKAFEVGAGASATGLMIESSLVRYFQPKKLTEIPPNKRHRALTGRDRYRAFPCKPKPSYKIPPGASMKATLFYEMGSSKGLRYQIAGVDASLMYMIFHRRDLYVSLKGGVSVSHNHLFTLYNNDHFNRFKYGVLGGVEMEQMLGRLKHRSFVAGWQQYRTLKDDSWGTTRWYAFVGLRFKINNKYEK